MTHPTDLETNGFERAINTSSTDETNYHILVLLVDFTDQPAITAASSYDSLLYGQAMGTVNNYYNTMSYGEYHITTYNYCTTIGWLRMPQTYAYYRGSQQGRGAYPNNSQKMVEDAVNAANSLVNYAQYDWNNDGYAEGLMVVHAGGGAEYGGDTTQIWSHAWSTYNVPYLDGKYLRRYSVEPEYWSTTLPMTCGVYCHEMGHAIFGLPDLYDTDNSSEGLGNWSLMAGGSWNGTTGSSPSAPDAWSRIHMGFATATNLTTNTIAASIPAVATTPFIYRMWTSGSTSGSEYFLVENRQAISYDAALPGNGLLIYHVDDSQSTNASEWYPGHTTSGHYKVALEQADGLYGLESTTIRGDAGDSYPGSTSNRAFNNTSTPGSANYSGTATNVSIWNIGNSSTSMTANLEIMSGWAVSPNGGERVYAGDPMLFQWSSPAGVTNVRIDLNRNYPSGTWETLYSSTTNDNSETWTVTGTATSTARIRVLNAANLAQGDTSEANFTIVSMRSTIAEYFDTFVPFGWRNAGIWAQYSYNGNNSLRLNYYSVNSPGSRDSLLTPMLDLTGQAAISLGFSTSYALYSTSYDSLIVLGRYANGSWNSLWRQGGAPLSNRTGRDPIAWRRNTISIPSAYQTSNVQFAFVGYNAYGDNLYLDSVSVSGSTPILTMLSPNGGETYVVGNSLNILWSSQLITGNVAIEINRSYPSGTWETIAANTANDGTEPWTVTSPASASARVRVRSLSMTPSVNDEANANFTIIDPLVGTKTIGGSSPDYATFAAAISALGSRGVGSGGVTFNIRTGTYNEFISVNAIYGASATNPIVFQKQSGTVTVMPPVSGAAQSAIVLNGASFVTFDGINVLDSSRSATNYIRRGYYLTNATSTQGAQNNTIKNCSITLRKDFISRGIQQYYNASAVPTAMSGTNSYNKYLNLKISKVYQGLLLFSNSGTYCDIGTEIGSTSTSLSDTNRMVIGALATDTITSTGISSYHLADLSIHDLDIKNIYQLPAQAGDAYGISIYDTLITGGTVRISNNRISNIVNLSGTTTFYSTYGIYVTRYQTTQTNIYNNMLWNLRTTATSATGSGTIYLIGIYTSCNSSIVHNSISLDQGTDSGLLATSTCIQINSGADTLINNIMANYTANQTDSYHLSICDFGTTTLFSDNNCFYLPNITNGAVGYSNATSSLCTSITDWQSATGGDLSSVTGDPLFTSSISNLHIPSYANSPASNTGAPITAVATDIDGEARSATTPDIGADEFTYYPPLITMTRPNGYELLRVGVADSICWTYQNVTGTVNVQINTNYPSGTWTIITGSPVNLSANRLIWTPASGQQGSNIRIRLISVTLPTVGDTSNANFIIGGTPLTGTKTIGGTSPNYATFADAILALSASGVGTGGVTFNVRSGTYNEFIALNPIPGVSTTNQVIFQKQSGTVTLMPPVNGVGQSAISLTGSSFVTFDGINVVDTSSGASNYIRRGYYLTNYSSTQGAQYNTIKNCSITLRKDFVSRGIQQYFNANALPTSLAGTNSYNKFLNLKISKVYQGVLLFAYSGAFSDVGVEIGSTTTGVSNSNRFTIGALANDTITGTGIYAVNMTNLSIHDIDITNIKALPAFANNSLGIEIEDSTTTANTFRIYNNRIYNIENTIGNADFYYTTGMLFYSLNGSSLKCHNNMIWGLRSTATGVVASSNFYVRGISSFGGNCNFDNNTISIDQGTDYGLLATSTALFLYGGIDTLRNNILANMTADQSTGAYHYAIANFGTTSLYSDRNCFYVPFTGNGFVGEYYVSTASNYALLADWQMSPGYPDANSRSGDPSFINPASNLHIQPMLYAPVYQTGMPVSYVTTDIDGESRNSTLPEIGADEYTVNPVLTLLRPNGGEVLTPGIPDTIRWNQVGFSSLVVAVSRSGIDYENLEILFDNIPAAPGYVVWTPTGPGTTDARIFIVDYNGLLEDWSDNSFTIGQTPKAPRNLVGTQSGNNIVLTWSRVDSSTLNRPVTVTGYKIYAARSTAYPDTAWSLLATVIGATSTTYTAINALPSTNRYYRVQAYLNDASSSSSPVLDPIDVKATMARPVRGMRFLKK